LSTNLEN